MLSFRFQPQLSLVGNTTFNVKEQQRLAVVNSIVGGARGRAKAPVAGSESPKEPKEPKESKETKSLVRRVLQRTQEGLGNTFDTISDSLGEKVLPAIVSAIVDRILKRIEGQKGDARKEVIKGGALLISDSMKKHNKFIPPPAVERILTLHRKGHRAATKRKFVTMA